ncbi:MAG: hypothetical protein H6Q04_2519, partial [Acidobacteria bacterium]|nr:hypothetical protein [Acidobacteriota bacterium]
MKLKRYLWIAGLSAAVGFAVGCDPLGRIPAQGWSEGLLGIVSLAALLIAVAISCISQRNVGIICIAFGFLIAMATGGV